MHELMHACMDTIVLPAACTHMIVYKCMHACMCTQEHVHACACKDDCKGDLECGKAHAASVGFVKGSMGADQVRGAHRSCHAQLWGWMTMCRCCPADHTAALLHHMAPSSPLTCMHSRVSSSVITAGSTSVISRSRLTGILASGTHWTRLDATPQSNAVS